MRQYGNHGPWVSPPNVKSVFNDDKIECNQLNFAQLISKDSTTARLITYQVETLSTVRNCDSLDAMDCDAIDRRESDKSTIIAKYTGEKNFRIQERADGLVISKFCSLSVS